MDVDEFGGVALEDAGWDDYSNVMPEDERYSNLLHKLFNPEVKIDVWKPKVITTTTTTPAPLSKFLTFFCFICCLVTMRKAMSTILKHDIICRHTWD